MVERAGFDLADVVTTTAQLKGAPGRMQVIRDDARLFVVDYAHTPDALVSSLKHVEAPCRAATLGGIWLWWRP